MTDGESLYEQGYIRGIDRDYANMNDVCLNSTVAKVIIV